jgi:uncharacterized BrkB/YihY/UPF0761 family membrane protein
MRRFTRDDADTHAAALAYQLFLSTSPCAIGGLAILGSGTRRRHRGRGVRDQ